MKCPSCGNEMKPGKLYCENCGEEVHIVPDFEAEVDLQMQNHLESLKNAFTETKETSRNPSGGRRGILYLGYLLCFLCIIAFFVAGIYLLFQGTKREADYLSDAKNAVSKGKYEEALSLYEKALESDDTLSEAKLGMADVYFYQNDMDSYVNLLLSLIRDTSLSDSQLSACYGKLVAFYDSNKDTVAIQQLITSCNNSSIAEQYEQYFAPTPEFEKKSGYYTAITPVKITDTSKAGAIYYTMDGTDPDENSTRYMAPIVLEEGTTVLKAIFISKENVKSEVATAEYHIEIMVLDPPVVLTVSGEYHEPTLIEVDVEEGSVYYTDDNSKPDRFSKLYTGPIEMPYGQSVFRFVTVVGSKTSKETECYFDLQMDSNYTKEQAYDHLVEILTNIGLITFSAGNTYKAGELIQFEYLTSEVIREKMYLIFAQKGDLSAQEPTISGYYGVEALTGEVVSLQYVSYRNYTISD